MWNYTCCVVDCKNNGKTSDCIFYKFPTASHKIRQRQKWIAAVKRKNPDGSKWTPKPHHVICNSHFIGKKKSDDPASPSYAPTLFPPVYHAKQLNERAVLSRYNRLINRRKTLHKHNIEVNCDTGNPVNDDSNNVVNNNGRDPMDVSSAEVILKTDQECQVDFVNSAGIEQTKTFTCNRYIYMTIYCDAEVQTEIPEIATLKTIVNRKKNER
ncbi:uncharacterized protein LOC124295486 [Neodiprion lecontei]|uniref:Uncharacterized protein LOC124295486 n=1 Tax=Neodiprion lecontei TaxID=441921 RepID=A0ABM3GN18_NEOLC|nr:uncharacterized protein LOC124295486 [Neodiprion lecontei]